MARMPERQYLNFPKHVLFSLDVGTKTAELNFHYQVTSLGLASPKRLLPSQNDSVVEKLIKTTYECNG
jgi:hypothetical protein